MAMQKILVVDDELNITRSYERILEGQYEVKSALGAKAALNMMETENFNLVISDFNMPGMNGVEFYRSLKKDVRFVIVTGNPNGVKDFPGPVYEKSPFVSIISIVEENLSARMD